MAIIRSTGYNVVTGEAAFSSLNSFLKQQRHSSYFILCDSNTLHHCLPVLIMACPALAAAEIIEIESGEDSKTLEICAQVLQALIEAKADKSSLFINLGGGVVSDLGGFTASIYKRGLDVIHIPTSLLAMADASVGGKTGIDFGGIKNSVGTFSQPKAVFIHPVFLKTLPSNHYRNGLAEIYKIALAADAKFWERLKKQGADDEALISKSVQLKNRIVLKDPFDKGVRKCLNFGHTIGHAIEALLLNTKEELLHGEAIVIGMLVESHIALQKRLVTKAVFKEIEDQLKQVFGLRRIDVLSSNQILELMQQDKKAAAGKLIFSLINSIGIPALDVTATPAQVKKAIDHYNSLL